MQGKQSGIRYMKGVSYIPRHYVIAIATTLISVRTIRNMGKELTGLPYNSVKWTSGTKTLPYF
jgi:hypothetical protein